MAILAAVSALALFVLVTESAGRFAGYILVILFAYNDFFLYALRRAMSEAPLLVCLTLAMLAGCSAAASWQQLRGNAHASLRSFIQPLLRFGLMGFLCGAATAAKLNGALAVLSGLALVALLAVTRTAGPLPRFPRGCRGLCSDRDHRQCCRRLRRMQPVPLPERAGTQHGDVSAAVRGDGQAAGFCRHHRSSVVRRPGWDDLAPVFEDLATVSFAWSWLLNLPLCHRRLRPIPWRRDGIGCGAAPDRPRPRSPC